jgi:hypothetical protein
VAYLKERRSAGEEVVQVKLAVLELVLMQQFEALSHSTRHTPQL